MKRILTTLALCIVIAGPAAAATPSQFIAKLYTEALGRIPDQTGWQAMLNQFSGGSCSQPLLKGAGQSAYLSTEYANLGYDNAARILTLYRGILNREPDDGAVDWWMAYLDAGHTWAEVVDEFLDSAEFWDLSGTICQGVPYSFDVPHGSFTDLHPVIDLPTSGTGFVGTQAQLQSALNATPSGGTLLLRQKAVVRLTSVLIIPSGVTLATTGNPGHAQYALMGRLVRNSAFTTPAVQLNNGAKLKSVWVDGQRNIVGRVGDGMNVQLLGGTNTEVSSSVLSNTAGWTTMHTMGSNLGIACTSNKILNNLITVYSSAHTGTVINGQYPWSDGLSISCENATVDNNEVVDATDVGIIIFRADPAVQKSVAKNNRVLASGNSAFAALAYDGQDFAPANPSFSGASFNNNTLWTSPTAHFDLGISVGTRAWFGNATSATGGAVTANTTGSQTARVDTGIAVAGMLNANVQSNTLTVTLVSNLGNCPSATVGAAVSAGGASGTIQPYTDQDYFACVGH
ncbi:MAG TPA: DUF4214 domain-containing protein [Thermoanaerobaculia bacterium]|nr:DUF4214 domain-containing protein [Thermoanaerobaculia bacterium]